MLLCHAEHFLTDLSVTFFSFSGIAEGSKFYIHVVTRLSHQNLHVLISKFATMAKILHKFQNNPQEQYLDYST